MRFSALSFVASSLRSLRVHHVAALGVFAAVSTFAHAEPMSPQHDVRTRFAQIAIEQAPAERPARRQDWRDTLDGQSAETMQEQQRRRISREERDHLRKHVRDAARDAYRDSPRRGGKGR